MEDDIQLTLPRTVYARLREMVVAGGKFPATGEAGIHSASQLLLFIDQQVEERQRALAAGTPVPNGKDREPPGKEAVS